MSIESAIAARRIGCNGNCAARKCAFVERDAHGIACESKGAGKAGVAAMRLPAQTVG